MKISKDTIGRLRGDIIKKQPTAIKPPSAPPLVPPPAELPSKPISYRFVVNRGEDGKITEISAIAVLDEPNV